MTERDTMRNLATVGLAIGAPVTLLSGLFIGVTLIAGPPRLLWVVFLGSGALTVVSLLLYGYLSREIEP
jgi:hypothetical protein